jgi:iron complex outermembrane receptor protein
MGRSFFYTIVLSLASLLWANDLFAQHVIVKGKVKQGAEVLRDANVSIVNRTVLTDHNGEFSFLIAPGIYTIVISYSGYKPIQQTITVNSKGKNYFEFEMVPSHQLGEVVVLGTRSYTRRSNLTSPVPIDVFSSSRLMQTGQISLTQMLNASLPSFNASREVFNEPATLRGLDPDHVLILVNGIRYHNMAWLFGGGLKGQLGRGSVANDVNSIPFAAIEKVEILRDGAAAQYGSDAIAGVINIQLKKSVGKTSVQLHTGQFYRGDGDKFLVGINKGFPLNNKGFLNLSASYRYQNPTYRGDEYRGTVYYDVTGSTVQQRDSLLALDNQKIADSSFNRKKAVDNAGNSKLMSAGFLANGGYSFNDHMEVFWTASINSRKMDRAQAYRFPKQKTSVNPFLFPNGFQPHSKPNILDGSIAGGIKAETKRHWRWSYVSSYGANSIKSYLTDANNASQTYLLGVNAPTSFYTGKDAYRQLTNDINFSKRFFKTSKPSKSLNIGYGGEWRLENYRTINGEKSSWFNYDTAHFTQGGVGAGGPENALNKSRNVWGTYLEAEPEFSKHLLMNAAVRYEYYSDFGGNIAAKFAVRYKFSDYFLARASINNGFRAPSLQQRYLKSIQTLSINSAGVRTAVSNGIFPNNDEVIKTLDIPSLAAEKSINISGGFTSSILNLITVTADAYWIQIKDRIVLSGSFERKTGSTLDSILDNYPQFNFVNRVSFFSNAMNTRTQGIDIVLDAYWQLYKANLRFGLAANFNSTRVYGKIKTSDRLSLNDENANTLLNVEERTKIEKGQPGSKVIMSVIYEKGKSKLIVRNTRYGSTTISPLSANPTRFIFESFSPKILTDISLAYSVKPRMTISLGADNVFNVYPDRLKNYENTNEGSWVYSPEASPFGFNGGYYFAGMSFNW